MIHYPQIEAIVEHGRGLGHKIGFPTANIPLPADYSAEFGVYFATVTLDGIQHYALLSIGRRPTIEAELAPNVECYILDFDGDIYGKKIIVQPLQYMRAEQRFACVEQLVDQIKEDVAAAYIIIKQLNQTLT